MSKKNWYLRINLENAAFQTENGEIEKYEIIHILGKVIRQFELNSPEFVEGILHDLNGRSAAAFGYSKEKVNKLVKKHNINHRGY